MFSKLNINELIFDLLFILLSIVNYYVVDDVFGNFLNNGQSVIITYSLIFLMVPMLLGVYMARIEFYYQRWLVLTAKWIIWIYYIVIFLVLMVSSFHQLRSYYEEELTPSTIFSFAFIIVFLIIGPICGGLLKSREEIILKNKDPQGYELTAMIIVVLATLVVMVVMINAPFLASISPFESPVLNILLGFVIVIVIATISIILGLRWESFFQQLKVKGILNMIRSVIIPIMIALIFFFLFKMEYQVIQTTDRITACGLGCKLITLLITGIIPFRVIMMISPPFKWLNFITGCIALFIMIFVQY